MTTILDKIIAEKQKEIPKLLHQTFDQTAHPYTGQRFADIIREKSTMAIIAEMKRASPSKGAINEHVDPVKQALAYEKNGASAISVLTDTPFFKGTMEDLRQVRKAVNLPILCKDFIIDKVQIDQAKAAGANIILLIAAALDDALFKALYDYAVGNELEVLCEVHDKAELERILPLKPELIGVNNRNLKTFEVDLGTTGRLANMLHDDTILISESGLKTKEDVETVARSGAEVILVGETFMRANDLAHTMQNFQVNLPTGRRS
jgi:indole-3-glycerol phosphate synthase